MLNPSATTPFNKPLPVVLRAKLPLRMLYATALPVL
jgi:hypothetical protein